MVRVQRTQSSRGANRSARLSQTPQPVTSTVPSSTNVLRSFLVVLPSSRWAALPRLRSARRRTVTVMLLTRRVPPSRRVSFLVVVSRCSRHHLLSPLLHLVLPIRLQPQPPLPTVT